MMEWLEDALDDLMPIALAWIFMFTLFGMPFVMVWRWDHIAKNCSHQVVFTQIVEKEIK